MRLVLGDSTHGYTAFELWSLLPDEIAARYGSAEVRVWLEQETRRGHLAQHRDRFWTLT